jgi:hypothetical protein
VFENFRCQNKVGVLAKSGCRARITARSADKGRTLVGRRRHRSNSRAPRRYRTALVLLRKPIEIRHLVSRRAYPADHKSLMNLAFSVKNSGFSNPRDGKFAQAANDNPLKMMDVGSLSGDPTPGSNFATLRALEPVGYPQAGRLRKNPLSYAKECVPAESFRCDRATPSRGRSR